MLASDVPALDGTLLAKKSSPFTIDYGGRTTPFTFAGKLTGTLDSSVYRDHGKLTFVYDVNFDNRSGVSGAAEASELRVSSFGKFTTSMYGSMDFDELVRGRRSSNGHSLFLLSNSPGLGGPPMLIVRTDATSYDNRGHAIFYAADEVPTMVGGTRLAAGTAAFGGIFRPVTEALPAAPPPPTGEPTLPPPPPTQQPSGPDTNPPGPTPTPIPLPPAAYSAIGVMLAMGLIALTRRGRSA